MKIVRKSSGNRLPEKWFRRGLWLVAVIFASFLIGLGGKIVEDLPQAEPFRDLEYYLDHKTYDPLERQRESLQRQSEQLFQDYEIIEKSLESHKEQIILEQRSLNNWLAARSVTEQSEQNPQVLQRTRKLDEMRQQEHALLLRKDELEDRQRQNIRETDEVEKAVGKLEDAARERKEADERRIELTVFLYRLLLTLPLLAIAGYLFAKHRQSKWWPFVWGFIGFALFAFFVELVPYLPDYGGYVRYLVGIAVTVAAGRYAVLAMQRYLERKQAEEAMPQNQKQELDYDSAQTAMSKGICPRCERSLDFGNTKLDFCPHCSVHLFSYCTQCKTRHNAFDRYCFHCGCKAGNHDR